MFTRGAFYSHEKTEVEESGLMVRIPGRGAGGFRFRTWGLGLTFRTRGLSLRLGFRANRLGLQAQDLEVSV